MNTPEKFNTPPQEDQIERQKRIDSEDLQRNLVFFAVNFPRLYCVSMLGLMMYNYNHPEQSFREYKGKNDTNNPVCIEHRNKNNQVYNTCETLPLKDLEHFVRNYGIYFMVLSISLPFLNKGYNYYQDKIPKIDLENLRDLANTIPEITVEETKFRISNSLANLNHSLPILPTLPNYKSLSVILQ